MVHEKLKGNNLRTKSCQGLPKNGVWASPPPVIQSPHPFVHALSLSLEEKGTDQIKPTFRGLQNWFWRARASVRFRFLNRMIRFASPHLPFPIVTTSQHRCQGNLHFQSLCKISGKKDSWPGGVGNQKVLEGLVSMGLAERMLVAVVRLSATCCKHLQTYAYVYRSLQRKGSLPKWPLAPTPCSAVRNLAAQRFALTVARTHHPEEGADSLVAGNRFINPMQAHNPL